MFCFVLFFVINVKIRVLRKSNSSTLLVKVILTEYFFPSRCLNRKYHFILHLSSKLQKTMSDISFYKVDVEKARGVFNFLRLWMIVLINWETNWKLVRANSINRSLPGLDLLRWSDVGWCLKQLLVEINENASVGVLKTF